MSLLTHNIVDCTQETLAMVASPFYIQATDNDKKLGECYPHQDHDFADTNYC
jgi:hypothetical protein